MGGRELTTLVELTEEHARKVCPGLRSLIRSTRATAPRRAKGGTRHPLQNVRKPGTRTCAGTRPRPRNSVHLTLHSYASSPPLCILPYYPFTNPHRRQTPFLISSFAANCSRSVPSGECQALRANRGEGPLKRGCAWRLRRVRPPRTTTRVRPVSLAKEQALE